MLSIDVRGDGCCIVFGILYMFTGPFSVSYFLSLFGKDVPAVVDIIVGWLFGVFTIPVAVIAGFIHWLIM